MPMLEEDNEAEAPFAEIGSDLFGDTPVADAPMAEAVLQESVVHLEVAADDEDGDDQDDDADEDIPAAIRKPAKKNNRASLEAMPIASKTKTPHSAKSTLKSKSAPATPATAGHKRKVVASEQDGPAKKRGRAAATTASAAISTAANARKRAPKRSTKTVSLMTCEVLHPPEEEEEEEQAWEIEKILDHGVDGKTKEQKFKVKWKGFGAAENTCEPKSNTTGAQELIDEYLAAQEKKSAKETAKSAARGRGRPKKK